MEFKERLRTKRIEKGFTLEEIAQKIGVSKQTINRYEHGVISNIPSDKIELLADALGTTPAYLMGWESERELRSVNKQFEDMKEQVFYYMGNAFSDLEINHMRKFDSLERKNQMKVISYTENLLNIQNMEKEQERFLPQAAHERTDIKVTDEMRKHDDNIMDDDDFWNGK